MRKKTKRKQTKLVNPIAYVLEGISFPDAERLAAVRMKELGAIDNFAHGRATKQDWHDINALLNLCELMARAGIGPEALEACATAEAALVDAVRRFKETERMGTTGPGLQAFRDIYEFHDLQRQSVSISQYEVFIRRMINMVKSKSPRLVQI